jgi:nucleoside-diphosphate-sugar epimerase
VSSIDSESELARWLDGAIAGRWPGARATSIAMLKGDASRAHRVLGWAPAITLEQMVAEMVEADFARHRAQSRQALPTEASLRAGGG